MFTFNCYFKDNSGKAQYFKVKASNKVDAIEKAFKKAYKACKGDFITWNVTLTH